MFFFFCSVLRMQSKYNNNDDNKDREQNYKPAIAPGGNPKGPKPMDCKCAICV